MPFTLPDKGEGDNDIQSILFQEYLDVLVAGLNGIDCVLDGCGVTSNANMAPSVAKGSVLSNGILKAVTAATVTIGTADGTNPRIDLIVIDSSGAKQVRAGTAAAAPKPPARTANDVVIAAVYVPASDTTIGSTQITDMRVIRTKGPIEIAKTTSATTFNTTSAIQTYFSITLPDGLFLSGKILRVRVGGTYKGNSATTWTCTIAYGGTTMFADATVGTGTGTPPGAWEIDILLAAQGDSSQKVSGSVTVQTPANKTAPTTGTAGDLAVATHIVTPIAGSAAVNSNNANRALVLSWTMNVSNANTETVAEYAIAELM